MPAAAAADGGRLMKKKIWEAAGFPPAHPLPRPEHRPSLSMYGFEKTERTATH